MADKVKVKFLIDYDTKAEPSEAFKAGRIYELTPASARHHTLRGRAEVVGDEAKVSKPAPAPAPTPSASPTPATSKDKDAKDK